MSVLNILRINDTQSDFDYLFGLMQQAMALTTDVIYFDFSECDFLRQNAVAFLGGLAEWLKYRGKSVHLSNLNHDGVARNLRKNGFMAAFGLPSEALSSTAVPYRQDRHNQYSDYIDYLNRQWLKSEWVHLSQPLRQAILTALIEAYVNVFDHAQSPIGVFSCGQFYPTLKNIALTLVDFGIGIPATVRKHQNRPTLSAEDSLAWAFQDGSTTKPHLMARGNGLKIIKEFVRANQGKLEIYSEHGYACIDENGEQFMQRPTAFHGTIVQVTLKSDEQYYRLVDESEDEDELYF